MNRIETWKCGCRLDHKDKIIDPCKEHVAVILAKIAEDNDGRIYFGKLFNQDGGVDVR